MRTITTSSTLRHYLIQQLPKFIRWWRTVPALHWIERQWRVDRARLLMSTASSAAPSNTGAYECESEAHLRLLSMFLEPRSLDSALSASHRLSLREPARRVLDRWISAGVLQPASALDTLVTMCTMAQIRIRLRERGQPIWGTKDIIAARLLAADPEVITKTAATYYAYVGDVADLSRRVPRAQRLKPPVVTKTTHRYLVERDIVAAVRSMADNYAAGMFPPGRGTCWADPDHQRVMIRLVTRIFESWPASIKNVSVPARADHCVAAAMMALLDENREVEESASDIPDQPHRDVIAHAILLTAKRFFFREGTRAPAATPS